MPQIEIAELTKIYSVDRSVITAADNISLKIEKGEFISIVGHSGSGKTTLLSLIGGIIRPTSGRVLYEGTDICSLGDEKLSEYRNEKIGFMFQFASLLPILTAKENVLLPGLFGSQKNMTNERKAMEFLEMVGIGDRANAYPSQLSGGQQRRVAIARALMNEPDVILADEPTGDLDEETEAEIMELFKELNREKKVTFVFITHSLDLAKQAGKQLRMSRGKLAVSEAEPLCAPAL
ncbi:MAG: ABC transporter ATP-binding protein [Nitrospiraceae bacterium]|nr:MAG: ABC transporter ATP-binding protein [Nitrospiraceae bacterium]